MRILITVPWGQRLGGAESLLQSVLDGTSRERHELELVFFEDGPWPQELRGAGFHVTVIPTGRLRNPRRALSAVALLARTLRGRRPDVIINWSAKTQLYGSVAAMFAGLGGRTVWVQHMIPSRWAWLDRLATALPAAAIACPSTAAARAQGALSPHRPTFVVAPGAPMPQAGVPPPALALPEGVVVVGLVGRLQPWKGQDRLLRAQAILRDRGHEIHTLIVGGDAYELSAEYANSLPRLVDRLGLAGAVTMTGHVPDAGPYLELMDILVNASDPEPFGIVLLEAMARGVPVLGVDSGGPAEIIEDGVTGVLARSGEPPALADALEPLIGSAEARRTMGEAGRERFMQYYTEAAMCDRLYASLEGLPGLAARSRP
jgi:glycosyltransferase involved in cell wall biosynthesis